MATIFLSVIKWCSVTVENEAGGAGGLDDVDAGFHDTAGGTLGGGGGAPGQKISGGGSIRKPRGPLSTKPQDFQVIVGFDLISK